MTTEDSTPSVISVVFESVKKLLVSGASAERILEVAPELIEAYFPREQHADLTDLQRAVKMARLLRAACRTVEREYASGEKWTAKDMLVRLFGLTCKPDLQNASLRDRTAAAAGVIGIQPRSFIRGHRENLALSAAGALYFRHPEKIRELKRKAAETRRYFR